MTFENTESEFEHVESDPSSSADLAAASLANLVAALMEQVENECSDLQTSIAEAMGVTPGRVSQIIHGDGNVRVSTLARLLDACGYKLSLTASPKAGKPGSPITLPRSSRATRRRSASREQTPSRAPDRRAAGEVNSSAPVSISDMPQLPNRLPYPQYKVGRIVDVKFGAAFSGIWHWGGKFDFIGLHVIDQDSHGETSTVIHPTQWVENPDEVR